MDKERGNFSLRGGGTGASGLERSIKRGEKGEAALLGRNWEAVPGCYSIFFVKNKG